MNFNVTIVENGLGLDDAIDQILVDSTLRENFEKVSFDVETKKFAKTKNLVRFSVSRTKYQETRNERFRSKSLQLSRRRNQNASKL